MSSKRTGVLVLILLAGLGIGPFILAIVHLRARADEQATLVRIKKLALALHACNDIHKSLPPAYDTFTGITYPASLHVHMLPFLDQGAVYQSFFQKGQGITDASVTTFQLPSDYSMGSGAGVQNCAANLRVFSDAGVSSNYQENVPLAAVMPGHASIPRTFLDGTSNTIVFGSKLAVCNQEVPVGGLLIKGGSHYDANPTSPFAAFFGENAARKEAHPADPEAAFQLAPRECQCQVRPLMGQSFSPKGIIVAMADGTLRIISPTISATTWNQALHPSDNSSRGIGDW